MKSNSKILKSSLKKLVDRFGREDFVSAILNNSSNEDIADITMDNITDNHYLRKAKIDDVKITQAKKTIKESGFYDPIIVRSFQNKHEVVIGRVKYLAAKELKINTIPVVVLQLSDEESLLFMLKEISDRKTMNIYELALICSHLKKDFNYKNKDLADYLNQSSSQISNLLQLLSLPQEVLIEISMNRLSYGHAKAICRLPKDQVLEAVKKIQDEHLSVRQTEALARDLKPDDGNKKKEEVKNIDVIEDNLKTIDKKETSNNLTLTIRFKDEKAKKEALKKLGRLLKKDRVSIE